MISCCLNVIGKIVPIHFLCKVVEWPRFYKNVLIQFLGSADYFVSNLLTHSRWLASGSGGQGCSVYPRPVSVVFTFAIFVAFINIVVGDKNIRSGLEHVRTRNGSTSDLLLQCGEIVVILFYYK